MDWLLRLQANPGDNAVRARLDDWIAADAAHADAWAQAQKAWRLIGEVPLVHAGQWAPNAGAPGLAKRPYRAWRQPRLRLGLAAAALAACLALVAVLPQIQLRLRADAVTATGEMRQVTLSDNSIVDL